MKVLKFSLWGYLAALSLVWWLSDQTLPSQVSGVFAWRDVLSQWTGVLAIGVMSLAVMLSARPAWVENRLGGLDKIFRLHKWLGISTLVLATSHWLISNAPKWLIGLGLLERPPRKPRRLLPEGTLEQLLGSQRGLAEEVGEWAFYGAALLMVLALIRYFPYRRFAQTHRFIALAYLVLMFHTTVLVKFPYWTGPVGIVLVPLMLMGTTAAILSLLRKHASGTRVTGEVLSIGSQSEAGVLAVELALKDKWPGHDAGQFAFVTFNKSEGAHPFSMTSAWQDDGRMAFRIKSLGDYTKALPGQLRVGDQVQIEGPYGRFNFKSSQPRQIWVAGGIGITPFLAGMQARAKQAATTPTDLFFCTAVNDPIQMDEVTRAAAAARVSLHVYWETRDGRLDVNKLMQAVPDWRNADLWFCGPARFGQALQEGLASAGLPAGRFHQELFEMR